MSPGRYNRDMLRQLLLCLIVLFASGLRAQQIDTPYKTLKLVASRDTIVVDSVAVDPLFFKLLDAKGAEIDSSTYRMDFSRGTLIFRDSVSRPPDTLTVRFLKFPKQLTKTHTLYDQSRVVPGQSNLYSLGESTKRRFTPFEGLNTSGSITRGVTIGNNQNAVVNSNLDLQITGKISDKVSLRASIQDSNIPLQDGGYSQKLDEFDQIFIELFSDKWSIRAGDLFLENRKSRFLNFNKKVQGISTHFNFGGEGNRTDVFASAALVRGQYARSAFTGQEGNQGPYKLRGNSGELYVLVVSGSERVYVNGILLKRGENNDYIIDYNAGEITFTSLFPITSEMRINVEYQFTDRNYTRFVTYFGASHTRKDWSIGSYVYSESDVKNQPLQQNLSSEQAAILREAGDDPNLMVSPSAYVDTYSENKILYRKVLVSGIEAYEYSNDTAETLYNVRFTLVGNNQGNYILSNAAAVGRIFSFVPPVNGVPQGNYEPIIRLIAPTKIQIATLMGSYNPSDKTSASFEMGISNNDLNLFSPIDDGDNQGLAGKFDAKQRLFTGSWKLDAFGQYQFVQETFKTIERLFNIEFNRDWNLSEMAGNQGLFTGGFQADLGEKGSATYKFENLDFSKSFSGKRQTLDANLKFGGLQFVQNGSYMSSRSNLAESRFTRNQTLAKYHFKRNWAGASLRLEDNQERIRATKQLSSLSQRFTEYGAFIGRGDSTRVFVEAGYLTRANDSLQNGFLNRVNRSHSYYVKSKLIQNETTDLAVFVNYRRLVFTDAARPDEPSLNSRILYSDRFFGQMIQTTAAYENASGTIAQQEFTYLEVEAGQGVYMWNDYNGNGIQELQEFEIAPYPDQAKYIRVFLPNQVFLKTHQNKFSAAVTLNPMSWQQKTGIRKLLSYFYNQTSYLIDRKIRRDGDNFDLNPFGSAADADLLGLNTSWRNSLFFNRGKQHHSVTYTFLESRARNLLSVGAQESGSLSHQLQYTHLYEKSWLFNFGMKQSRIDSYAEQFAARNYEINGQQLNPKISYLFSQNTSWDVFYEFQKKRNQTGDREQLDQSRIGTSFSYLSQKKLSASAEFSLYNNAFTGSPLTPAGFQMLEGLQPGRNLTWRLLLQKNLTQYLDINVNYLGRKSPESDTVHTGSIQLRAYF